MLLQHRLRAARGLAVDWLVTPMKIRCGQVWRIAASAHARGKLLPTMDAMAFVLGCSRSSVQRAIGVLVADKAMALMKVVVLIPGWRNIRSRSQPTSVIIPTQRFRVVSVELWIGGLS